MRQTVLVTALPRPGGASLLLAAALVAAAPGPSALAGPPLARGTGTVCPADRLPPMAFADVPPDAGEPACALGLGLVRGVTSTRLDREGAVTRGAVAQLLVRAATRAGVDLPRGADRFADLADAPPAVRDAVARLEPAGVVAGRADGTYGPSDPVTRAQAASLLVRLQRVLDGPLPEPADCADDVDGVHADAVGRLCALGVAVGTGDRQYRPHLAVSRGQAAALLARLLDVDAEAGLVAALPAVPTWSGTATAIDEATAARMGSSYRTGCPVPLSSLRLLAMTHWGFDGTVHSGEMVVHADAAGAVLEAFRRLYAARIVVEGMRLVDEYGGDDNRSMAANNTSAFNCRTVAGSSTWSQHAYGRALDLNPVQNPFVQGGVLAPPEGAPWRDRTDVRPGMAVAGGPVVAALDAVGWGWGGSFSAGKDYQHFSANGR